MFNRKAKKIKLLQDELSAVCDAWNDVNAELADRDDMILSLKKELDELYQEKARLDLNVSMLTDNVKILSNKLDASVRINKKLKKNIKSLTAELSQIKDDN